MPSLPLQEGLRQRLHQALLAWFGRHARSFPWRQDYQPYQVWVSEIMLQQTQAERGVACFRRWMDRLPDVASVAAAPEEVILKLWEGLGYYSRARNLQAAARCLVATGGELPATLEGWLALPGIGPYTARAILSIAYQADVALVDANVQRLFARLFAIDTPLTSAASQERIWQLAEELLPRGQARNWNQALMEQGALICGRGLPRCGDCPLAMDCQSRQTGTEALRPVTVTPAARSEVHSLAAVILDSDLVYVQQRPVGRRWARLWEFPGGELPAGQTPAQAVSQLVRQATGLTVVVRQALTPVCHSYTRYRATVHPFLCQLLGPSEPTLGAAERAGHRWLSWAELATLAFSAGHRRIITALGDRLPPV